MDLHIPEIQTVLQNLIGIDPGSTVGGIGIDIPVADVLLAGDVPFCGEGRVVDFDGSSHVIGRVQKIFHELLNVLFVDPGSAQSNINFMGFQIFGLCRFQSNHIVTVKIRVDYGGFLGHRQLFPDVAG